jgi:hypothetical protein
VHRETQEVIETGNLIDNDSSLSTTLDTMEFVVTPYRWLVLAIYTAIGLFSAMMSMTISPQALLIQSAYGVSLYAVTFCTLCFGYAGIFMYPTSMTIYAKLPPTYGLRGGGLLMLTGCWLRSLSSLMDEQPWWPVLTGTLIIAIAAPLFFTPQNVISNRWFGDKERAFATAISGLAIPLGSMTAFI